MTHLLFTLERLRKTLMSHHRAGCVDCKIKINSNSDAAASYIEKKIEIQRQAHAALLGTCSADLRKAIICSSLGIGEKSTSDFKAHASMPRDQRSRNSKLPALMKRVSRLTVPIRQSERFSQA